MKIKNRLEWSHPLNSIAIWLMPSLTYIFGKVGGAKYNNLEFIWWICIPIMFLIWFFINFKIEFPMSETDKKFIEWMENDK